MVVNWLTAIQKVLYATLPGTGDVYDSFCCCSGKSYGRVLCGGDSGQCNGAVNQDLE